jgi:hypothetical protein
MSANSFKYYSVKESNKNDKLHLHMAHIISKIITYYIIIIKLK